jgi:hypothetical protein
VCQTLPTAAGLKLNSRHRDGSQTSTGTTVRLLKTLGILAAVAVSCGVGFVLLGFPVGGVAGPDAIGAEIGRMLFLFVVPAIPTSIVYWFRAITPLSIIRD